MFNCYMAIVRKPFCLVSIDSRILLTLLVLLISMFKLADGDCKVSCSSLLACLRAWRYVRKLSGQAEGGKTLTEIPSLF